MLMFKKKFLDAIRAGKKTQTLRYWKRLRIHSNQKSFIPGIGPVWIDSVDEVSIDNLTDDDAIPDGFASIEELKNEINNIYGTDPKGKLYRIRFHLMVHESPPETETLSLDNAGKEGEALYGKLRVPNDSSKGTKPQKNSVSNKNKNKRSFESSLRQTEISTLSVHETNLEPESHVPEICEGVSEIREEGIPAAYRDFVRQIKLDVKRQLDAWDNSALRRSTPQKSPGNQKMKENNLLTEEQLVEKMIRRCRINRNVCDWNHEPGKSQDFFALFLQAPRNENGIPIIDGYRLRSLMRSQLSEEQWEEICWIAVEICAAWTEWQYAIEHWHLTPES